jgi:hypothetical protein
LAASCAGTRASSMWLVPSESLSFDAFIEQNQIRNTRKTKEMMTSAHRYPQNARLKVPASAHRHLSDDLPTNIQRILISANPDQPIRHDGSTYFPSSFKFKELQLAYQNINTTTGWTKETRSGGVTSYVVEFDNGKCKVRMALHHNKKSPNLITVYPVSRIDRQRHGDFFDVGVIRARSSIKDNGSATNEDFRNVVPEPIRSLYDIARSFRSQGKFTRFYCDCPEDSRSEENDILDVGLVPQLYGHSGDCKFRSIVKDMSSPSSFIGTKKSVLEEHCGGPFAPASNWDLHDSLSWIHTSQCRLCFNVVVIIRILSAATVELTNSRQWHSTYSAKAFQW